MRLGYFKAQKDTHRFRSNQKVWVVDEFANYLTVCFRWRGSGRYVRGTISRYSKAVGPIKYIDVDYKFFKKIKGVYSGSQDDLQ